MQTILLYTHLVTVVLFTLLYAVKAALLLANKTAALATLLKQTAIPERITAFILLATGIYLIIQLPAVNTLMIVKLLCVVAAIPVGVIAYKRKHKILAVVSLLLLISAYGLAEASHKRSATGTLTGQTPLSGREIYLSACSQCHGDNGNKALAGAADLSVSKLDEEALLTIISNGKGSMPAYKNILNEQQLMAVAGYIKTLKK